MQKNSKKYCLIKLRKFFNSTFASWFIPTIIIGIGIFIYKSCQSNSTMKQLLEKEIGLRIKLAKKSLNAIETKYAKNNTMHQGDYKIYYDDLLSNLILPNPQYHGIDSAEYNSTFRNDNLSNLCLRYSTLKNKRLSKKTIAEIESLKTYFRFNGNLDTANFYQLYQLVIKLNDNWD